MCMIENFTCTGWNAKAVHQDEGCPCACQLYALAEDKRPTAA